MSIADLDQSGITNFSLEFEMLNKMQVTKNNPLPLNKLPVVYDVLMVEGVEFYKEDHLDNGTIRF